MRHFLSNEAPESLPERIYRMRMRRSWVDIARILGRPVSELQHLIAPIIRGRSRTPENLLG